MLVFITNDNELQTAGEQQCTSAITIRDSTRHVGYRGHFNSSGIFGAALWYRFMDDDMHNFIPDNSSSRPDSMTCGSIYTGYVRGAHPSRAEGAVTRSLCFGYTCDWMVPVTILQCNGFYVYNLPKRSTDYCWTRICTTAVEPAHFGEVLLCGVLIPCALLYVFVLNGTYNATHLCTNTIGNEYIHTRHVHACGWKYYMGLYLRRRFMPTCTTWMMPGR